MVSSSKKRFARLVGEDAPRTNILIFEKYTHRLVHQDVELWIGVLIKKTWGEMFMKNVYNLSVGKCFSAEFIGPHAVWMCQKNKERLLFWILCGREILPLYKAVVQILVELCCFSLHEHEIVGRIKVCSVV